MTVETAQAKRTQGTPAKVKIEEKREKGGFVVQEEGKPKGVLNLGPAPATLPEAGALIDVFIQDDAIVSPQYRWDAPVKRPVPQQGKKGFGQRGGGGRGR
jgi:hypothetical protein